MTALPEDWAQLADLNCPTCLGRGELCPVCEEPRWPDWTPGHPDIEHFERRGHDYDNMPCPTCRPDDHATDLEAHDTRTWDTDEEGNRFEVFFDSEPPHGNPTQP